MEHELTIAEYRGSRNGIDTPARTYPFVTISRLAGAGGGTLASTLLKRLNDRVSDEWARGWQIYDRLLCQKIAEDPEVHASFESLLTEDYKEESRVFFKELRSGRCDQYILNKRILSLVRAVAMRGKAIIVGRAGNFATHDLGTGIHVRLVDSEERRVNAMMTQLFETEAKARKQMHGQDEARARLVQDFFCRDINDPLAYHLVVNTGLVPLDDVARFIEHLVAEKVGKT